MKMDADIYGIMPNAKMEACKNAPPENVSIRPSMPFLEPDICWLSLEASIPGSTIKVPIRYIKMRSKVYKILLRKSSMLQIFLSVLIKFFTEKVYFYKQKKTQLMRLAIY